MVAGQQCSPLNLPFTTTAALTWTWLAGNEESNGGGSISSVATIDMPIKKRTSPVLLSFS